MSPPLPIVPPDWKPVDPFPRVSKRSFVSDDPDGDRLRVAYFRRGDEQLLRAKAWFGPGTEGPPGIAHGGSIASVLDEALGGAAWLAGYPVVVARLTVDFEEMLPLGTDATIESMVVGVDGRKVSCRARLIDGSTQFARAEALCIVVKGAPDVVTT